MDEQNVVQTSDELPDHKGKEVLSATTYFNQRTVYYMKKASQQNLHIIWIHLQEMSTITQTVSGC